MEQPDYPRARLMHFPISFFSVVMGLAGLTISWGRAGHFLGSDVPVNAYLLAITATVFGLIFALYAIKLARYREQVAGEWGHPVKLSFFPTISISLLLLAIAFLPVSPDASLVLWAAGTVTQLVFTLSVMNIWIHHDRFEIQHLNPAWFIPVVGNVLVPVAGVPLGFEDVAWFFFSIGIVFWVVLLSIVFNRVLFHHPIDRKLMPTLFILIAPPAVGFVAWVQLAGEVDAFGKILYNSGLFLTLLLLVRAPQFIRLEFSLSWWAYTFPLAAISIASFVMAERGESALYGWIGCGLLALLTAVVGMLSWRTGRAVAGHGICVPEPGAGLRHG